MLQNEVGSFSLISILQNSLSNMSETSSLPDSLGVLEALVTLSPTLLLALSFCYNWHASIFGLSLSCMWAISVLLLIASDIWHILVSIHQADKYVTKLAEDLKTLRRDMSQNFPAKNLKLNKRWPLSSRLFWPPFKRPSWCCSHSGSSYIPRP